MKYVELKDIFSEERPSDISAELVDNAVSAVNLNYNIREGEQGFEFEEEPVKGFFYDTKYIASNIRIDTFEELTSAIIRMKYTQDAELAILRQRDEKPEEFQEYFNFAEKAKAKAKEVFNVA